MGINYEKLFDLLEYNEMSKIELKDSANISYNVLAKLEKGENISLDSLEKICNVLNCNIENVVSFDNDKPTLTPFVKWVGGKRQLYDEIKRRLPQKFNTYFEPFLGGGSVLFLINPKNAYINDANEELINCYLQIKNNSTKLIYKLDELMDNHQKDPQNFYLKIRNLERLDDYQDLSDLDKAARFIYLNKTCFNGLYRVNSKGYFNVPWNKKEKVNLYDFNNIMNLSNYLNYNNIKINCGDFSEILKNVKKGDFVYIDPPYDLLNEATFDSYTKEAFGKEGQIRLAQICHELNKKGCYFLLSNHNTELINELYQDYHIDVVNAKRLINSNAKKRQKCEEVLIYNYEV